MAVLNLQNSTVSGNVATFSGSGIHNAGFGEGIATLEVTNSTIDGNMAPGDGGGIYNDGETGSAILQITNSTLSGNSVDGLGGGVYNDGFAEGNASLSLANTILGAGASGENIYNDQGTIISRQKRPCLYRLV